MRIAPARLSARTREKHIIIESTPNNWGQRNNWGQSKNSKRVFTLTPIIPKRVFTLTPIILLCVVLLSACQRDEEQGAELYVFGTIVEIKLWGASPEEAALAFMEIQQMFQAMHRNWHAWEPGRLVEINKAFAEGRPAIADEDIVEMVRRSQPLETLTGGRFNPAIGALIRLWGFHTSDYPIEGPPPSQDQINGILDQRPSSPYQRSGAEFEQPCSPTGFWWYCKRICR